MPRKNEELCAIAVFRAVWKMLKEAEGLEEAREAFRELLVGLILEE